jgi:hypothetical protein
VENPTYYTHTYHTYTSTESNPPAAGERRGNKKICPRDQVSFGQELMMMDLMRGMDQWRTTTFFQAKKRKLNFGRLF